MNSKIDWISKFTCDPMETPMDKPLENYWSIRLAELKTALEANNFDAHLAADSAAARTIVVDEILPKTGARSVSFGGSLTAVGAGLYQTFKSRTDLSVIDTLDKQIPSEEQMDRRRKSLLVDLFITGSNAVTEDGQLVNLDMQGNRVAALTFGPKHVVVLLGRNKIVPSLDDAMFRVKNIAAPANAMRLDKKTPCVKTSYCEECKSPDRICNTWTITEKSYPKGRVKVVLINQDLGL
jgi:L-lactate utilization protein LutB